MGLYDLSPEATVRVTPVVTTGLRASGSVAELVGGAWVMAFEFGHTHEGVFANRTNTKEMRELLSIRAIIWIPGRKAKARGRR